MKAPEEADFPRREFRPAKSRVYIGLMGVGILLLCLIAMGATKIFGPELGMTPQVLLMTACLAIYVAAARALLSRLDFDEVALALDHEGIHVTRRGKASIPWASIDRIRYYELGRFQENKIITISKLEAEKEEMTIDAHLLRGSKPRELYETIRQYRRHFAPVTESKDDANVRPYASSSWTGLDDD